MFWVREPRVSSELVRRTRHVQANRVQSVQVYNPTRVGSVLLSAKSGEPAVKL